MYRFFGAYHGIRKTLLTYNPHIPQEANVALATTISITPLIVMPKGRPIIPYAIFLIVLDVANNWKEHGALAR